MIKKIVIVGGGTAGWMAASFANFLTNPNIEITLIESKEIPIVGVGESTTGAVTDVFNDHYNLGDVSDFLKKTGATYKYGIKHTNWVTNDDSFLSPIGCSFEQTKKYPTLDYDHIRILHIAENKKFDSLLQNRLMDENKLYYIFGEKNNPYKEIIGEDGYRLINNNDIGLHIDAYLTAQYLKEKLLQSKRLNRIEDTITSISKDEKGFVKSLKLKSGQEVFADFFLDVSGWSKTIMKEMGVEFVSFKNNLITNRAGLFPKLRTNEPIKNHTVVTGRKHGWTFEVPLQTRIGRGYVYNSDISSDEDVMKDIGVEFKKIISFENGRLNKMWVKNVLSIGLCSHFVEPLEATGLHTTSRQLEYFFRYFFTSNLDCNNNYLIDDYNNQINSFIDDLRDFILLHYQSKRKEDFWLEASSKDKWTEEFNRKMQIWKSRMPRECDYHHKGRKHDLGNALWIQVGHGYGIFNSEVARQELKYYNLESLSKEHLKYLNDFSDYCVKRAMTTNEYYKLL